MNKFQKNESFKDRINTGLSNHWAIVLAILILIILSIAGILVYNSWAESKQSLSSEMAEDIQRLYGEWNFADPDQRSDEELLALIDKAISEHKGQYAAEKGYFVRGKIAFDNQEWDKAIADFEVVAESWPKDYLAPISLFNAASAREQKNDLQGAKENLLQIVEQYKGFSPSIPEALFNLGRIAETENDNQIALERYKQIENDFPDSRWTNLAKSRMIVIRSKM